jgi:hypothetical protein
MTIARSAIGSQPDPEPGQVQVQVLPGQPKRSPYWKKTEQLGMPFPTACARLRRIVLFQLLRELRRTACFRCGDEMSVADFSLDHKVDCMHQDPELFWDVTNIAFSHVRCNVPGRPAWVARRAEKVARCGPGMAWCNVHRGCAPLDQFGSDRAQPEGRALNCKVCAVKKTIAQRRRRGRRLQAVAE